MASQDRTSPLSTDAGASTEASSPIGDLSTYIFGFATLRMVADGVPYADIVRLKERITSWPRWLGEWSSLGQQYEIEGEKAMTARALATAGEHFWHACISWHYGQFMWFHDPHARHQAQLRKVELYERAAPLMSPSAERIEVPFEDTRIPGYLRRPMSGSATPPCVILVGGLESTKEESYLFENLCLSRGLATFAFDGPAQGEYFRYRALVPDFERYTSAVVDHLSMRDDIDKDRLAILGRSLGGCYAVRSAAHDPRLKACVAWCAVFDLSNFANMRPITQHGLRHVTRIDDESAAETRAKECIRVGDIARDLRCALYVMHGGRDSLFPMSQVELLDAATPKADKVFDIEPDGDHCAHNLAHWVRPRMADWLAGRLRSHAR